VEPNVPYDGEFTFVRLRYTNFGPSGWAFDYPAMERNFSTILHALTTVHPHRRGSNIHTMDDPELFNYTVAISLSPGIGCQATAKRPVCATGSPGADS
jgi:hypothetical protein